ncbi:MAG: helix-turn-helix domain-containing protein [Candidatus Sericytochromatia bacterium]|nr:helix-turn-helix domain-containing protein [Candidatus Sericytochromatia bacterium]
MKKALPIGLRVSRGPLQRLLEALLEEENIPWHRSAAEAPAPCLALLEAPSSAPRASARFAVLPIGHSLGPCLEAGTREAMNADRVMAAPDECRVRLRRCFADSLRLEPAPTRSTPAIRLGQWRLDLPEGVLSVTGYPPVSLTPTEARLSACLLAARGRPVTREVLMSELWDDDRDRNLPALLKRYVARLRRHLEISGAPARIRNLPGVGYAWQETESKSEFVPPIILHSEKDDVRLSLRGGAVR